MLHHTSSNAPNTSNGAVDYNKYATGLATNNNSSSIKYNSFSRVCVLLLLLFVVILSSL
jgi:hypothetical protein